MPANLPPEYIKTEKAFRDAKTIDEKIERLEDMIALLPKHKGTDHLFADLKRRLSRLKNQQEATEKKSKRGSYVDIERVGAAQVILVGPPNCGKSSILNVLTNANPEIGLYPFTTHTMQPGMVPYQDIQIQMVDTPPVTSEYMPRHLLGLVRKADGILLICDMGSDTLLEDTEAVINAFKIRHVEFVREKHPSEMDTILTRVIANKMDAPDAHDRLVILQEMFGNKLDIIHISCKKGEEIKELPSMLFKWLKIVRVYTKTPGEKPDLDRPYTVFAGQTVADICALIHKDFLEKLRFARLWRGKEDPVIVSRNEEVRDGDILELHI